SSRALCGGTRAGGTGGKPDHGNHRQPECQGRAKRGAALDPQGFDSGKKISGRKRHILVDTLGLLLSVAVHAANIQDRDGMTLVLDRFANLRMGERPMWKPKHRLAAADRSGLRYPSDLIDAEWAIIEPMIPPAKHSGRKRTIDVREILNGIFYVLSTGCQWQALPKDLPPKSTVWAYFDLWTWDGTLERIHHAWRYASRRDGRQARPRQSSTARVPRARKKGGRARPAGLRFGQEDQRSQAPHSGRYARPLAERGGACRQHSGSRRDDAGARPPHASFVPVH